MTDDRGTYERDLTPEEITARGKLRDELDNERDALIASVEDRRKEVRGFNVKRKRIEVQLRDVRRELSTGKVFESRQGLLALDEPPARHGEGALLDPIELQHLITCVRPRELWPTVKQVSGWHEQVRADVQKWARAEHARANPIAGAPLPPAVAMPNVLENIALEREEKLERKRKASKRKAQARAAKPRSAGGTPIRKGQGGRAR